MLCFVVSILREKNVKTTSTRETPSDRRTRKRRSCTRPERYIDDRYADPKSHATTIS